MMSSIPDIRARLVVAVVFLAPAASRAVNVPLPVEGSTVNLTVFVQTQALLNENGSPDGQSPSYDVFIRRSRLQANGDIGNSFSYYFQVDNTNFELRRHVRDAEPQGEDRPARRTNAGRGVQAGSVSCGASDLGPTATRADAALGARGAGADESALHLADRCLAAARGPAR